MDFLIVLLVSLFSLALFLLWRIISPNFTSQKTQNVEERPTEKEVDPYQAIVPLRDFDWRTTPPIFNAPLKPKYHLTMALETLTLSELIDMDNTFLDRMRIRKEIMGKHEQATLQCNPVAEAAVGELYEWMVGTYLPGRFPMVYVRERKGLRNTASGEVIPYHPPTPKPSLRILGEHVDTDFLLLLPSSTSADGSPIYHLEAFVSCFPAGFSWYPKLGLPLAAIHTPVPGYKEKLERSMDRFFARLECGRIVKRSNWSITTDSRLFAESGFHAYSNSSEPEESQEVKIEECRLRSERQTLFRLPKTKALVFSFKTYQYRLEDMKKDGYGEELARAIEGLGRGNVPEMEVYKRGRVWGRKVLEFLRS